MESVFIFYFFILLVFLKNINIDYRLIIFIIISIIFYNYHYSKKETIEENLKKPIKKNIYNYGNEINKLEDLNDINIRKIKHIKDTIFKMDIHKNDKIETYSIIKKYFHIYNNYNKYYYKHNWINDLHDIEVSIYNKISSLNISYENMEEEIHDLFNKVEIIINNITSKFNNNHVYNNIDYPSGYDKNLQKSYLF